MMTCCEAVTVNGRRALSDFLLRVFKVAALAGFMAGCASTDVPASLTAAGPAPSSGARLKLVRGPGILYMGAQASVRVNGQEVANLWRDSSTSVLISPGANVITVGAFLHPGVWTINLNAQPGATYTVEISPRGESYAPAVIGGLAGTMIDAAVNENAGAFKARLVQ